MITDDGATVEYQDLVLATGSRPVPLPVPGGDHPELMHIRDLTDGHRLRALAERPTARVAVIGSGFIGCEAAASLALGGLAVVLVSDETTPHETRLGAEAGPGDPPLAARGRGGDRAGEPGVLDRRCGGGL